MCVLLECAIVCVLLVCVSVCVCVCCVQLYTVYTITHTPYHFSSFFISGPGRPCQSRGPGRSQTPRKTLLTVNYTHRHTHTPYRGCCVFYGRIGNRRGYRQICFSVTLQAAHRNTHTQVPTLRSSTVTLNNSLNHCCTSITQENT